jgi:hypothetical protein
MKGKAKKEYYKAITRGRETIKVNYIIHAVSHDAIVTSWAISFIRLFGFLCRWPWVRAAPHC